MVYCCVPFCTSSSRKRVEDNPITFHEFPSDMKTREVWLKNISRENFVINENSASSVVCSKHFKLDDYVPGMKSKRLVKGSVPSIFQGYPEYKIPKGMTNRRILERKQNKGGQELPKRKGVKRMHEEKISDGGKQFKVNPSMDSDSFESDSCSVADAELLLHFANSEDLCSNPIATVETVSFAIPKSPLQQKSQCIKADRQKLVTNLIVKRLRSSLWKKNLLLQKQKKTIDRMQNLIKYYEDNKYHAEVEKIIVKGDLEDRCANFILQQIENLLKKKPRWNESTIRECVIWNYASPKGYELARQRKLLVLPCKMTLSRYVGPVTGEFGVTSLIKQRLQQELYSLNEHEKFASLIIDEMAIRPQYIFDKKLDCCFGQITKAAENAEFNQQQPLANRLLCFVLCGLSTNFRIPCGYFFSKNLTAPTLHKLTLNVLEAVETCGFPIIRIVTDNYKTNVALFRRLGQGKLTDNIPHPHDDQRTLFLSFDQNHLIKNIRSLFLEKEMTDGIGVISGKFVKLLYKLQQNENIKAVRNLTYRTIEPSNIDKMNVRRAVLIFSPPVTSALEFLRKQSVKNNKACNFSNAGPTIKYLINIYKWFTVHDVCSRHEHITSKNTDKMSFFLCNDERLEWLETDFLQYLSSLEQACKDNIPPLQFLSKETYEAIVLTTKSTVNCIKYLLKNGYHYVLTRFFNSDPVESLFSALRQMNGGNDIMDVRSTLLSLETILKTGTLITSKYSNVCTADGIISSSVKNLKRLQPTDQKSSVARVPIDVVSLLDKLHKEQETPRTTLKFASIAYIAGYLVRVLEERTNCPTCLELIAGNECRAPIFNFIASQSRGGLCYPKATFVMLLSIIQDFVEKAIPFLPQTNVIKNLYSFVFPELQKSPLFKCSEEHHTAKICSVICMKFLPVLLKNIAKNITDKTHIKIYNKPLNRKFFKLT